MKVNLQMIKKIWDETQDNPELLKATLKHVFSFRYNIGVFGKFFFPDAILDDVPEFHNEWYDIVSDKTIDAYAFAAPRGHSKSTTMGLVFLAWCIVNEYERYIVYISQNHTKTTQLIEPLRNHFTVNKMLHFVYGNLTPGKSRDEDGRDREDCIDVRNTRIEAVSFEKNLRGFKYLDTRPTLIIGDDIEDDERVLNPELRFKDMNKINKAIIPARDINGRFIIIGTILHHDSLLQNKINQYNGKIYRALDINNVPLWPKRFTYEKLMRIKADIGSIGFQQEYMNDPVDNSTSIIKREWIEKCFNENLSMAEAKNIQYFNKTLGVDFAFSDRVSADQSAFVSLGLRKDSKKVLFQGSTKKGMSAYEQLDYIKDGLHLGYNYDIIALEENSIKSISKDLHKWNLPFRLYWLGSSDPANKLKSDVQFQTKRYTVGKVAMIQRLAAAFEREDFVIPYKTDYDKKFAQQLLAECCSWALSDGKLVESGVHPDIPIGLCYANESINSLEDGGFCVEW